MKATARIEPMQDEFLARFYRWAKEFSQDQFDQGFPALKEIKNRNARNFVGFAESLNRRDRNLFRIARLKRFHPRAAELAKEIMSPEEDTLLRRYSLVRNVSPFESSTKEKRMPKAQFRTVLLNRLRSILGDPIEGPNKSEEWEYRIPIGPWIVGTRIDIGGRSRMLGYGHSIWASEYIVLHGQISILNWMGIASQTDWASVSEADTEKTLESVERLCKIFIGVVPRLLENIFHSSPAPEIREWKEIFTVASHQKNGYTALMIESSTLRGTFGKSASWEIPTSIIPEALRPIGSRLSIVQDPAYDRRRGDALAMQIAYRHLRITAAD